MESARCMVRMGALTEQITLETGDTTMPDIRHEPMSPIFDKWHLGHGLVLHRFAAPDTGPPHDHPFSFISHVIRGGYVEAVYADDGSCERVERKPGDQFLIGPNHIHRIVDLLNGECWTVIEVQGEKIHEPGFYEWRHGEMWSRRWFEEDFRPHRR